MSTIHLERLSSFGRLALKLDEAFSELARLSGQIQRLDIDSESGLERAVKLLDQFAQQGTSISSSVQDFSRFLREVSEQSEVAARAVAERAQLIQQRKEQQNLIRQRLNQVEEKVAAANASLAGFRKEGKSDFSAAERIQIRAELERLNGDMKSFLSEAHAVKDAASQLKFKSIEREAQGLLDALRSSSRRVDKAIAGS